MKLNFKKWNWGNLLLITLITFILVYIVLRASVLSFVHDESITFQTIFNNDVFSKTSNNHFLNTLLVSFFYKLFGNSELSLRFPNIIGFLLYAISAYAIFNNKNIFLRLIGFVLLFLNPYLVDFFGLARGYGLALGLFMAAFYFFIKAYIVISKESFVKNAFISLFFSLLATVANFTFINFYFATLVIFIFEYFILFRKDTFDWRSKHSYFPILFVIINVLSIVGIIIVLIILKKNNQLYFGGYHNNFIDDTVLSLANGTIYQRYYGEIVGILLRQIIISVFVLSLLFQFIKQYDTLLRVTIVLFVMIGGSIIEYYLFNTPYPTGRTALIYIPLFGIYFLFVVEKILTYIKNRVLFYTVNTALFLIIGVPIAYHFVKCINFKYTYEWNYDANTKQAAQKIKAIYEKYSSKDRRIVISNNWVFEPSLNFYRTIYNMDYLLEVTRWDVNTEADFIYMFENDLNRDIKRLYTEVTRFESTKSVLLKRKVNNFEKPPISNTMVQLKTSTGRYVCVDSSSHRYIYVNNKSNDGTAFSLIKYANDECAIRSYTGQYFCAELGMYGRMTATRTKIGAWESFKLIELGNGYVAFKAVNDKYLSVDEKTLQIYAKATYIGETEKFKIIPN